MMAVRYRHPALFRLLLYHQADTARKGPTGKTPQEEALYLSSKQGDAGRAAPIAAMFAALPTAPPAKPPVTQNP